MNLKTLKYFSITSVFALGFLSCNKMLDINENPNAPTKSTPQLVFPQAMAATARTVPTFSFFESQLVGYFTNGGGVSGWGAIISYNYTTADFSTLWNTTYNILEDIQYVLNSTQDVADLKDFNAAASIFKVYNFQNLADVYNDIPYSDALKGAGSINPKYDKAQDIYKNLGDVLDTAIAYFKTSTSSSSFKGSDFLFKGDNKKWAQFANTLKLRMLIRAKDKVAFTKTTLDDVGFISDDVIANPGFAKLDGKQNPTWDRWAYNFSGTAVAAASQYAVSPYTRAYYDGSKLTDAARANLLYKTGNTIPLNQLGYQGSDAGRGQPPSSWFRGTSATDYEKKGILKGPTAGQPLMLTAESYFLQAEAVVNGLISGNATNLFETGIKESFEYLNKNETDALPATVDAAAFLTKYKIDNNLNYLVNFSLAATNEQKIEAIITQKYIAFNMLFGHEAWNDYRRTGYPKVTLPNNAANKVNTFVSIVSESTAADKLPTRVLYPNTEYSYNSANIPTGIDKYSSKIFWAK